MLKKLFILLFVIAPLGAFAQEKIAYINTDQVFAMMPELKDVETKLSAKQQEITTQMQAIRNEYDKKVEELQNSDEKTEQSVLIALQGDIQKIQERFQTYTENSEKEFGELRQQLLAPLQEKFQGALKAVGEEQSYTYIIEAGAARYISPKALDAGPFVKTKLGIK